MKTKKTLFLLLALMIFSSSMISVAAADVQFPDLSADHWAYSAVMQLVDDGTVNGMSDGTYAPNKLVTRAEFAKMIGKIDTKRDVDFSDLTDAHWSYEYVMWSGIEGDSDNTFRPDEPMLRDDVVAVLWERNGRPSDVSAPSVITGQSSNPNAVAWAYTYGLMIGDDGIDLRLDEGISRAEVASLIVRSRNLSSTLTKNFIDVASDDVLKVVFEGSSAFDKPYSPDGTLTNGELARAALRLASEEYTLRYSQYSVAEPFEHEYVKDLYAIGTSCIGEDKITPEFIDKSVNNLDMVSMLTFAMIKKSNKSIVYDTSNVCYSDIGDMEKNTAYTCLAYANGNGIQLYSDKTIKPEETATMRSVAAVLLQLDDLVGTMSYYQTNGEKYDEFDISISRDVGNYPENSDYFTCVLEGLPSDVYTAPFMGMTSIDGSFGRNPAKLFEFARDFKSLFLQLIIREEAAINSENGITVRFTFYPQLTCDNTHGFTCRLKTEIVSLNGKTLTYGDIFRLADGVDGSLQLEDGMLLYNDADMPYELGSYADTFITFGNVVSVIK